MKIISSRSLRIFLLWLGAGIRSHGHTSSLIWNIFDQNIFHCIAHFNPLFKIARTLRPIGIVGWWEDTLIKFGIWIYSWIEQLRSRSNDCPRICFVTICWNQIVCHLRLTFVNCVHHSLFTAQALTLNFALLNVVILLLSFPCTCL